MGSQVSLLLFTGFFGEREMKRFQVEVMNTGRSVRFFERLLFTGLIDKSEATRSHFAKCW